MPLASPIHEDLRFDRKHIWESAYDSLHRSVRLIQHYTKVQSELQGLPDSVGLRQILQSRWSYGFIEWITPYRGWGMKLQFHNIRGKQ